MALVMENKESLKDIIEKTKEFVKDENNKELLEEASELLGVDYIELEHWDGRKEKYYDSQAMFVPGYLTRETQMEKFGDKFVEFEANIDELVTKNLDESPTVFETPEQRQECFDVMKKLMLGDYEETEIITKEHMAMLFPPVKPNRETRRKIMKARKKRK